MNVLIQIYEIGNREEACQVSIAGVDHVGILVGKGEFPREIRIEDAKSILEAIRTPAKKTILTLTDDFDSITEIATRLKPDLLQLGMHPENFSPNDVLRLKRQFPRMQLIRTIPVTSEKSIGMAKEYDGIADFLLLDTWTEHDHQLGATGKTHDWRISKAIVQTVRTPVILAGGLGPENVTEAIRHVQPAGVDSKTKTDREHSHQKDLGKIKRFVEAVRKAESLA